MAKGHAGLPAIRDLVVSKKILLEQVSRIDSDSVARDRVLTMESRFRTKVQGLLNGLPTKAARLFRFGTNPFVLLEYSRLKGHRRVRTLEQDILPAKLFSSMETSAGNMVQSVALPIYGWEDVQSKGYSIDSEIDGRRIRSDGVVDIATLKSGPRCLNDALARSIAQSVRLNAERWATDVRSRRLDFTYGAVYGTERRSNKKDWHILRSLSEEVQSKELVEPPHGKWSCSVKLGRVDVKATVRIGADLWRYIGGSDLALVEIGCALIRACIEPTAKPAAAGDYDIGDMGEIVALPEGAEGFNSAILQQSQLEWLFLFMWHFYDYFEEGPPRRRRSSR